MHEKNLLMGLTYIRNGVIAKVFREAGYSEKLGTGFRIIFSSYQKRQLRTPRIAEGENFVKCILPREKIRPVNHDTTVEAIRNLFETAQSLSSGDIAELLNLPRATLGRKLAKLVKEGILIKKGAGNATRYSRSA
jgi:predicted HTH transcriptional regulator